MSTDKIAADLLARLRRLLGPLGLRVEMQPGQRLEWADCAFVFALSTGGRGHAGQINVSAELLAHADLRALARRLVSDVLLLTAQVLERWEDEAEAARPTRGGYLATDPDHVA